MVETLVGYGRVSDTLLRGWGREVGVAAQEELVIYVIFSVVINKSCANFTYPIGRQR